MQVAHSHSRAAEVLIGTERAPDGELRAQAAMATAFRFVFTGLRFLPSKAPDGIQLSEVTLFGPDGGQLPILAATNPGGQNTNPNQPAGAAVDGLLRTKWFDAAMVARGQSTLQLQLAAPSTLYAYELWTGNDNTKRDPVSWRVERLEEDGAWREMSRVVAFYPPVARRASYGRLAAIPEQPGSTTPQLLPSSTSCVKEDCATPWRARGHQRR